MKQNQQFTIGLVVVAVALGGYMYFVESKKEAPTDTKDVEVWSLSDAAARDIKPLVIMADGKTETYNREGDDWKLASQPTRTVDASGFKTSFDYLKNLTASRKVEDKPSDPGKYGFKTPNSTVTWGDANTKYKLEIGDKTPTNDGYYVHVLKDDGVYTIASYKVDAWKGLVSKPPLTALPTPAPTVAATTVPATGAAPASGVTKPAAATAKPAAATAKPAATKAPAATTAPAKAPAATAAPTKAPAATTAPAASGAHK